MKKIIYTLLFLLSCNFCKAENINIDTAYYLPDDNGVYPIFKSAYNIDTIEAILLITECNGCFSKSINGYVIQNYNDNIFCIYLSTDINYYQRKAVEYLDKYKKPFPKTTIVWGYK